MRNGKLIWSGLVTTIDHKEGLFGRREPYGVAKANQWKAGDVITKKAGVTVIQANRHNR